jgi:hypothetical protein
MRSGLMKSSSAPCLWVWVTALLLSACAECEKDFDCPGTEICGAEGECEAFVCASSDDCAPGQACSKNRCRTRENVTPPPESPDAYVLSPPGGAVPSAPTTPGTSPSTGVVDAGGPPLPDAVVIPPG